jgi:uncharacterized repeat protein (TIGR01451 family)
MHLAECLPRRPRAAALVAALAAVSLSACSGGSGHAADRIAYRIAGHITENGQAMSGVTVALSLSGATIATATTDPTGAYTLGDLSDGSYTVTPSLAGFVFTPESLPVTVSGADVTGRDFTAVKTYTVSGRMYGPAPSLSTTAAFSGTGTLSTNTDATGAYTLVVPEGTYTLTPARTGYKFSPATRDITVAADVQADFSVAPSSATYTIDWVAPDATSITIGSQVLYTAILTNWTAAKATNAVLQNWIEQGTTLQAAGGALLICDSTLAYGDFPPGTCSMGWEYSASTSLVPGPATLKIELKVGLASPVVYTIPITLVAP